MTTYQASYFELQRELDEAGDVHPGWKSLRIANAAHYLRRGKDRLKAVCLYGEEIVAEAEASLA